MVVGGAANDRVGEKRRKAQIGKRMTRAVVQNMVNLSIDASLCQYRAVS
jgi:hypothetical protein